MSNKDFRHREYDDVEFGRKPKKEAGKGKSTKQLYYADNDYEEIYGDAYKHTNTLNIRKKNDNGY